MTTTARVSKLPECDVCKNENPDYPPEDAQYDGKTRYGTWGYMCERHFQSNGVGLGLGKGQRLITKSEHTDEALNRADRLCQQCRKGCPPYSYNVEEIRHRILDQPQKIELMIELGLYCEEVVYF
jgi:hypothetical protein